MEAIHAGLGALGARRWARRKRATAVTCVATAVAPTARAWFNRGAGAPNGVDEHCLQLSSLDNKSDAGSKLLVSNIERASGAKSSKTCLSQPETTSREARLRKTYSLVTTHICIFHFDQFRAPCSVAPCCLGSYFVQPVCRG